ncbi:MAG: hypothetical protein C4560_01805 [Nitrospiraceae bacterium]|nr:MAG: hypothetical protein C4560_01805 [Nitrospiraceae bacterium]
MEQSMRVRVPPSAPFFPFPQGKSQEDVLKLTDNLSGSSAEFLQTLTVLFLIEAYFLWSTYGLGFMKKG